MPEYKRNPQTERPYATTPPRRRPFVSALGVCVHFRVSSNVARDQVAGRVEHVVSGQSIHFNSLEELLAFIDQVLTTVRALPRSKKR